MGCGNSSGSDQDITKKYAEDEKANRSVHKLLMLGSGASGKSTLFKQLGWLYGEEERDKELNETDRNDRLSKIRENIVVHILELLRRSQQLYESDKKKYKNCVVDFENEGISEDIKFLVQFKNETFTEFDMNEETLQNLGKLGTTISRLWKLKPIQATFSHRGKYSFSDNMDYFFDKGEEIFTDEYICTEEDYLKTRVRTTGFTKVKLQVEKNNQVNRFEIVDVGGQRNERSKWIHQFDTVICVIFVAALNHYATVLFEDETKNAMHESLELFENILNLKHFGRTEMIIFLNKEDLFREKLLSGQTLDLAFTQEKNWDGVQWMGGNLNYVPGQFQKKSLEDEEYFANCYDAAVEFIKERYEEKNANPHKVIYCHTTTATDKHLVEKVFNDVQNIVIRANLARGGLLMN